MKKIINLIFALLACLSMQGQDTIFLNGTNQVNFSLNKPVKYYYINCVEYATRTSSRSISNVGTILFKTDGSGTFKPVSTYKSGTWTYYEKLACGLGNGKPLVIYTRPPVIINKLPIAISDNFTTVQDVSLSGNILNNDSDPDGDPISVQKYVIGSTTYSTGVNNSISGGTININSNGSFTFNNSVNFSGNIPTITYTIIDGKGGSASNTLNITVTPKTPPSTTTYTLNVTSTTSAGVYEGNKLIRTLWNNKQENAGTYSVTWDGKDDNGVTFTKTSNTKIRVISHQMAYNWKANIGNSSTEGYGPNKIRALRTPWDGVVVGNYLYMCTGFVEGNSPLFKVALNNISYMIPVRATTQHDIDFETRYATTDGTRIYWAGFDAYYGEGSNINSVIYATNVSNDQDYIFSSGTTVNPSLAYRSYSAIGVVTGDLNAQPTGLAVMTTGNYLYSTRKAKSELKVFNKTTGSLVRTIPSTLGDICIDGNNLYGIDGTTVKKYTINSDGSITYNNISISLNNPVNVSSTSGLLMVVDAGTNQVKAYNSSGQLQWVQGQQGGYFNSPSVTNDKFQFLDYNDIYAKGWVAQSSDGSYWVGDAGNCRTLHYNSSKTYLENISYLPMNYNCGVNKNEPTRVFAGFLEFNSLTGVLVNNWSGNLTTSYLSNQRSNVFYNCVTLNGRTYGTIYYYPYAPSDDNREFEVVELTSTGLRYTGKRFGAYNLDVIETNGDHVYYDDRDKNILTSGTGYLIKEPFLGIDGSGNIIWGSPQPISSFPLSATNPFYKAYTSPSSKGYIFSDNWNNTNYHFGRVYNNEYIFKTSKSTARTYTGEFPLDGRFDCGNGVEYAGKNVYNSDSLVVWNYIGEFWKNSQTNIWNLFHQDGLMLMQIGKTTPQAVSESGTDEAPRESAGNALMGGLVKIGNSYYIFHCDESVHGAIHSFEIIGANTIKIHYITP